MVRRSAQGLWLRVRLQSGTTFLSLSSFSKITRITCRCAALREVFPSPSPNIAQAPTPSVLIMSNMSCHCGAACVLGSTWGAVQIACLPVASIHNAGSYFRLWCCGRSRWWHQRRRTFGHGTAGCTRGCASWSCVWSPLSLCGRGRRLSRRRARLTKRASPCAASTSWA